MKTRTRIEAFIYDHECGCLRHFAGNLKFKGFVHPSQSKARAVGMWGSYAEVCDFWKRDNLYVIIRKTSTGDIYWLKNPAKYEKPLFDARYLFE